MKELFTVLEDRTVRFDGISVLHPEQVERFLLHGLQPKQLRVSELTQGIQDFNSAVAVEDRVQAVASEPMSFDMTWLIPEQYLKLDVEEHVLAVFGERLPGLAYDDTQTEIAVNRVAQELAEFERRGLFDLLRVIIYVLDRFRESKQVFGVGRGSSCASFILFLLGLHVVDPVVFDVPLEEFMHD